MEKKMQKKQLNIFIFQYKNEQQLPFRLDLSRKKEDLDLLTIKSQSKLCTRWCIHRKKLQRFRDARQTLALYHHHFYGHQF